MDTATYFPVKTASFVHMINPMPFDVFLRLGQNKYAKIFHRTAVVEPLRLESYILKGTEYFYIQTPDRPKYLVETLTVLKGLRNKKSVGARQDSLTVLDEIASQALNEVIQNRVFNALSHTSINAVVETYLELTGKNNKILTELLKLSRTKRPLIKHMTMTSIFSVLLAKAYDVKNVGLAATVGYAGLVHDIGLSMLATQCDEHAMNLSSVEKNEIHKHPQKGSELLGLSNGVSPEVHTAVMQHHESYDGSGYPRGISKEQISLPARILHICETFSSLVSGSANSSPLPPALAIHTISKNSKFDPSLAKLFANLLNP